MRNDPPEKAWNSDEKWRFCSYISNCGSILWPKLRNSHISRTTEPISKIFDPLNQCGPVVENWAEKSDLH